MAQTRNRHQPRSMTLMAGPIDTRLNPTGVNRLAQSRPIEWFERELIDTVKQTTPARFVELRKLAYTLDRRRADILAYFDHPRTSNGPTEAINGRLEHLRGSALGFRNLTNYIARSLLEAGGFRPYLHSQMR